MTYRSSEEKTNTFPHSIVLSRLTQWTVDKIAEESSFQPLFI